MKEKNKFRNVTKFNSIKELVYNSVKRYRDNIAFVTKIKDENKNVSYVNHTYKDLLDNINAFGTSLHKLNLRGKRVAILGRNRYEWSVSYLNCLMGDMVVVPLDKELQLNELQDSLIRSKADAIIFDEKYKDNVKQIKENNKTNLKYFISMKKIEDEGFEKFYYFDKLLEEGKKEIENGNNEYIECITDPDKMSILLFTSGTTSKSKAVMLNQTGIVTNIADMQMVENFLSTDTNIAFLPFHHIFGSIGMLVMVASGIRTVFPDGLRYIKQNISEYQVSLFVGVPILVDKMYENIEKEIAKQGKIKLMDFATKLSNFLLKLHIDLRRVIFKQVIDQLGGKMRFIIAGGAPLDRRTAIKFNEMGIHLVQGYGLTETSPVIAAENDYYQKPGSVGIPMRSMQTEIVNKDSNGIGELRVKGPNVMMGYYENEEVTNQVLKDGWFYTGDLGYIDDEGFLFITGRQKDVIVLKNGKKVFPEELEILVNKIEEIDESFVYGIPRNEDKNDLKVCVEVVYNEKIIKEKYNDIKDDKLKDILWEKVKEVNKSLPQYKYIKDIIITNKPLIKTTTNKTKRKLELAKILKEENLEKN